MPVTNCGYKIDTVSVEGATPHTHTIHSEIIQTFENEGSILINGELYKMQKNGLYFIHGLSPHFVSPADINKYNHSIITLHIPEIEHMCSNLKIKKEYETVFIKNGGSFCSLSPQDVIKADMLFLEVSTILNDNKDMKYARLANALVNLLDIGISNNSTINTPENKISDIISFISDNALEKISIDDICKKTHVSKYHLCRIFKENVGVTIGCFIKTRRLSVAKQLLVTTNLNITQIAYKCGFTDSGFFTKTFTKEFGMSPTSFRAKYR